MHEGKGPANAFPATVLLLDERGRSVGRTRSAAGLFEFTPRSGGHYSLRVQRIGYATHPAPPVELASGESVEVEFRLSIEGVLLAPITALGRQGASRGSGDEISSNSCAAWARATS